MLFDAHNHIHLGPSKVTDLIPKQPLPLPLPFAGIALMSTHPRDFDIVTSTCSTLSQNEKIHAIPCYGLHPWFIHELENEQNHDNNSDTIKQCFHQIEDLLSQNPNACVGEIGLDGARWTNPQTKELSTPMPIQQTIFETQLQIAYTCNRPVSVHVVHAWGPFFQSMKRMKMKLPTKMYMHAFGGKPMVVNQIIRTCSKTKFFFGFAPMINFRSHRVKDVIQAVGIDRLLLETDLENGKLVYDDLCKGATLIADALDMPIDVVLEKTYQNAQEFYGFQ